MGDDMNATLSHLNWRDTEQSQKQGPPPKSKRIPAGICGIFLGCLGVHKFVLGYTKEGVIMLLITVFTLGFFSPLVGLIGLIEGIVYLTKTDPEFIGRYQTGRTGWF